MNRLTDELLAKMHRDALNGIPTRTGSDCWLDMTTELQFHRARESSFVRFRWLLFDAMTALACFRRGEDVPWTQDDSLLGDLIERIEKELKQ